MTQPGRILWFAVFAAAFLLLPSRSAAQNSVTPTVKPTPPGQLIVVNNGPGDQVDPHVDGDLVCYRDDSSGNSLIRYRNLATGTDNGVPPPLDNSGDTLCDVRGTTIVFTRESANDRILVFDTAVGGQPMEIAPVGSPGICRFGPGIGDQTIAWSDVNTSISGGKCLGTDSSSIVAYDRATGATSVVSPASAPLINENLGMSPDGGVIVWAGCDISRSQCQIWKGARSSAGTWDSQQLVTQFPVGSQRPDTDGTIIAYAAGPSPNSNPTYIVWQPLAGGAEQVLNLPGSAVDPSVGVGLIAFAYGANASGNHQIALYNIAANVLYNITSDAIPGDSHNKFLPDVSVTPDGKVRIVWQEFDPSANGSDIYAYTFNLPVGDFSLSPISPLTTSAGASASTNLTINPVNGFSSVVDLSVSGAPVGVMATVSPAQVIPSGGNPASSILNVSVSPALAPTNFTLTVTGTSGTLTHSATADVTVTATTSSTGNLIGDLLGAGCIDNGGIANALTSKLSAAQGAGNVQTAINILTALKNQINAQAGKHIATACTIAGVAFNPVTVLLLDVQGLIDSLRVSAIPDPVTGYVVDANGVGAAGAAVSILDAGGNVVATATTDVTGFYFFATMSVLTPGANYTVAVTGLPPGFVNTPLPSPAFMWSGTGMMIGNFVLN